VPESTPYQQGHNVGVRNLSAYNRGIIGLAPAEHRPDREGSSARTTAVTGINTR
jgi:hypothetical protein